MSYILKDTSPIINTRLTDVGRRKISEGNFNVKYFQIGDSEITYILGGNYDYSTNVVLMPNFNEHNNIGRPSSNKQNVKYPFYVDGVSGNTYGIPFMESVYQTIYNTTDDRGFFDILGSEYWYAENTTAYTKNTNYIFELSALTGTDELEIISDTCSSADDEIQEGDIITLFITDDASCGIINKIYPILTYKVKKCCTNSILQLDRKLPNLTPYNICGSGRVFVYPSGMTELYDTKTPLTNWDPNNEYQDTKIWNMNIPWSESPAGISTSYRNFNDFGSSKYLGTKEYFGYGVSNGSVDTSEVFYYNSLSEKITVKPEEQKAITIIHYTNNSIDNPYGEKFALEPKDDTALDDTGQAKNFKVELPWVMWHKSPLKTIGLTLYVDPPNDSSLFKPYYIKSTKNTDMDNPGIRYYHLWDNYSNRVGKVFPDSKIIIIDDEELIAVLSYKSGRNWTLAAPKISLIPPNVCDTSVTQPVGLLTDKNETLYVTYRLDNYSAFTNSLHSNYYQKIQGPNNDCNQLSQNVSVQFGEEFKFLTKSCLEGVSCINPIEDLFNKSLEYSVGENISFNDAIFTYLDLGFTTNQSDQNIKIKLDTFNPYCCPDQCKNTTEPLRRYVLASVETYLKYAEAVELTYPYQPPKCCRNVAATVETYLKYSEAVGVPQNSAIPIQNNSVTEDSILNKKCNSNFDNCLYDILNSFNDSTSILNTGIVEDGTFYDDTMLCYILSFINGITPELNESEKKSIIEYVLEKGIVVECTENTFVMASVETYLKYWEATG